MTLLLTYVMCFSGALAILNSVPCVALDGQFMWVAVLDLFAAPEPISGVPDRLNNEMKMRPSFVTSKYLVITH